ncbi:hypothetical protein IMZ31_11625 [Pontibacillus sp. ALD_SL1]|uniref:sugar diacid recognition domain-containing protein n=1 Tax=Pontibacillus sp. ALD_SL1 TaxID=2777185 RepID=UPI001A968302|nr:sugar diacid recognition domain-containing protein [Pontibacillus sp. ALD_SL1]QSS98755.1 hypothetical protein IMZ31_11625 [Pontibacillus sp. ALD_SL1]
MNLTESPGQEIIDRLSTYIDVPINLMNPKGIIIASTNKARVHHLHEGAKQVASTQAPCTIYPNDLQNYKNTQAGVNLPVFHRGKLTGVVGLTRHPDDVTQAAGMTQGSVEITLDQIYLQRQAFYEERQWIQ